MARSGWSPKTYCTYDPELNPTRDGWLAAAKAYDNKGDKEMAQQCRDNARMVGANNSALRARRSVEWR